MTKVKVFAYASAEDVEEEFNSWSDLGEYLDILTTHWAVAYDVVKCKMIFTLLVVYRE